MKICYFIFNKSIILLTKLKKLQLLAFFIITYTINSYAQSDSLIVINSWTLNSFNQKSYLELDTSLNSFHLTNSYFKNSYAYAYNGNYGSPVYPLYFSPKYTNNYNIIPELMYYYKYLNNNTFYNTRKPYSIINFFSNTNNSVPYQNLNFIHSQNINPNWNVGLAGNFASSKGEFQNQENKHNHYRLFSSYNSKKYTGYVSFNSAKLQMEENGGIINSSEYTDSLYAPSNIMINLSNGKNTIQHRNLFQHNSINIYTSNNDSLNNSARHKINIINKNTYHKNKRLYEDIPSSFYQAIYIDSTKTYDSLEIKHYYTDLLIEYINNNTFNLFAGLIGEQRQYLNNSLKNTYNGIGIKGGLRLNLSGFIINASSTQWLSGFQQGLMQVESEIYKSFKFKSNDSLITILQFNTGSYAPYRFDNYISLNNFNWNNNFSNIHLTNIIFRINYPKFRINFSAHSTIIKNHIYYNNTALPNQYNDVLSSSYVQVSKTFMLKQFGWKATIVGQTTSNDEIICLPNYYSCQSFFYTNKIFNVLDFKIGADVFIFGKYYNMAYMPSTMAYYNLSTTKSGNYPIADIFISMKLKRARFLLKMEHVNDGLIMPRNNYSVLNYPMPDRAFSFGISWGFYD